MNIKRFQFILVGLLGLLCQSVVVGDESAKKTDMKAIDFKNEEGGVTWRSVNDSVMGGRSEGGSYETEAGNRIFKGEISLKNNGGFSSVRSSGGEYDLSGYKGVEVKVRGDGRMYYFTARADNNRRIAFWYPIQTKAGEWVTLKLPFKDMYATSFGRKIKGLKLNTKNVTSFGLMLYDKKDGNFSIEVESMKVY